MFIRKCFSADLCSLSSCLKTHPFLISSRDISSCRLYADSSEMLCIFFCVSINWRVFSNRQCLWPHWCLRIRFFVSDHIAWKLFPIFLSFPVFQGAHCETLGASFFTKDLKSYVPKKSSKPGWEGSIRKPVTLTEVGMLSNLYCWSFSSKLALWTFNSLVNCYSYANSP